MTVRYNVSYHRALDDLDARYVLAVDNTELNPGAGGDTIATDDVGGIKYQYVKLTDGTDGSSAAISGSAADGLLVNLGSNNDVVVSGSVTVSQGTGTSLHMVLDSGTVTTVSAVTAVSTVTNLVQLNGAAISMNSGVRDAGTQRVTVATNDSVPVVGSVTVSQGTGTNLHMVLDSGTVTTVSAVTSITSMATLTNLVQLNGAAISMNTGVRDAGTQRVTIATNDAVPVTFTGSTDAATQTTLAAILISTQLLDDAVYTDDTSTHSTGVSKGYGIMAAATPTDTAVTANDIGMLGMTNNREMYISVRDIFGTTASAGSGTATNALRVELANNGTGVLATVGTVTTVSTVTAVTTVTNPVTVAGGAAHASPVSGNPNLVAGRASTAVPTDVGADGDAASIWTNRNGAPVVTAAPHVGILGTPWDLVHEGVQYTTAQTSAVVVAGGASEKIVVTKVQIQAFGTTSGTAILYFGTGAYARGTNRAIFDGEFKPSSTLAPGVIMDGPFISGTNGDDILFTSVGDVDVTLSIWYYIVT